jgi:regulatory protein
MARIVAIQEGANGTAKAVADDGSLFHFRHAYLSAALEAAALDDPFDPCKALVCCVDVPDEVLAAATGAFEAEKRACSLLARAEQHRAGLERKLAAKDVTRWCARVALDRLETDGLLSDRRFAESWIRQRMRSRAEGPRSLASALAARGVDAVAVREALAEILEESARPAFIARAAIRISSDEHEPALVRSKLIELGWRRSEIDDAMSSMETC